MNLKMKNYCKAFLVFLIFMQNIYASEKNAQPKKYKLSICSVFKNEEKFLKEWIEYHRLIGVEHFYLYSIQTTDHSVRQLQNYIRKGIVTLTTWPGVRLPLDIEPAEWSLGIQIPAYEHAAKYRALPETEWLVFLDINEYLLPGNGLSITDVLNKYAAFPAIDLQTEFFDASKIDQIPRRELLIQTVELSKPFPIHPFKQVKKTIFKPEFYVKFNWPPYTLIFKDEQKPIATSKSEMRINQYTHRFNGYITGNRTIGKAYVDNRYMAEQEIFQLLDLGYEIEDQSRDIFRFVPQLLKNME